MYIDIIIYFCLSEKQGDLIMDKSQLKTSEAHRKANMKWQKANYSRIPLDVPKEYHIY